MEGCGFGGGGTTGGGGATEGWVSPGSGGVVAGWDCTDEGGVAADCVCSTGGWAFCCPGCVAGCCCAAAISEPPTAANINSFPKSCCRLTNHSSIRNPRAGLHRQKQSPVSPFSDSQARSKSKTAPIVAVLHLNRVRKRCRTISYTNSVVTVFPERVKRSVPGAYGRPVLIGQAT